MPKNGGVTDFVLEIRYLKGHTNFKNLVLVTSIDMAPMSVSLKLIKINL